MILPGVRVWDVCLDPLAVCLHARVPRSSSGYSDGLTAQKLLVLTPHVLSQLDKIIDLDEGVG